jgi:hypothetical protein
MTLARVIDQQSLYEQGDSLACFEISVKPLIDYSNLFYHIPLLRSFKRISFWNQDMLLIKQVITRKEEDPSYYTNRI